VGKIRYILIDPVSESVTEEVGTVEEGWLFKILNCEDGTKNRLRRKQVIWHECGWIDDHIIFDTATLQKVDIMGSKAVITGGMADGVPTSSTYTVEEVIGSIQWGPKCLYIETELYLIPKGYRLEPISVSGSVEPQI
jgi:hypothetical protein